MDEIKIWKRLIDPWIPKLPNDEISGKLLRIDEKVGTNESMLYTLETEDSVRGVWGSTVLDEKMKIFEVGDYVKIVFLGRKKGGKKDDYKDFDVYRGAE